MHAGATVPSNWVVVKSGHRRTFTDSPQRLDQAGFLVCLPHLMKIVSPGILRSVCLVLCKCFDPSLPVVLILQGVVEGRAAIAPIHRT